MGKEREKARGGRMATEASDLGDATVYVDGSSMSRFLLSRRSCQKACGSYRQGEDKARVQCHRQCQPGHLNRGRRHRRVATTMVPHCVAPEYSRVLVHKRRCAALNHNHFITDVVQTTPRGLGTQRCSPTPWPTYGPWTRANARQWHILHPYISP